MVEPRGSSDETGTDGTGEGETPGRSAAVRGLPPAPSGSWSLPSRIVIMAAVVVLTIGVTLHLLLVFLFVAPPNAISKKYDRLVKGYVYPEFDQNWQLFAPNPLQDNIAVHARAEVAFPDGSRRTTNWLALTAQDIREIRRNPVPSHAHQNLLRQAWDFYNRTHDAKGRAIGLRGELSEAFVRRIAAHRLGYRIDGGQVVKVQIYAMNTPIIPPKWSGDSGSTKKTYQVLPWWPVSKKEFP
ncbi:hypothetical protein YWIDRAFT_01973 [Streptomyces sp. SceaMP-e96]|uniref:DUF5819 family protein n=1 Tax=unclassified Streptomyces TaxID=2593676 RepID=UPI000823C767|nr:MULTISPECIES: DUF5819 family protein [unclassified Streptomyces]MYT12695.1 hypothetical protein [Streptomyces sp. SID4951]SCK38044.1 hypothetical protein YWIDRAFT_01973 [Streptomyces sp. SceaMP-e96]